MYENDTLTDQLRMELVASLTSMQSEPSGWLAVVQPSILPEHVRRLDNNTVRIELHAASSYSIIRPETITLVVPPSLVRSQQPVPAVFGVASDAAGLRIQPTAGNGTLHGSFMSAATRADVRSSLEHTLAITLAGDRWQPSVGLNDAACTTGAGECASRALLDGIASAAGLDQEQQRGWRQVLGADASRGLSYLDVEREDDHTVHIRLPQHAAYFITSPETLIVTLPASTVLSDAPLTLAQPLRIAVNRTNGRATLGGSFLLRESLRETALQLQENELTISLVDDTWIPTLTPDVVSAIAGGLRAHAMSDFALETYGWMRVVQPSLTQHNITRVNDTVLAISFKQEGYDLPISEPELLTVVVPPIAVTSAVTQEARPALRIEPIQCTVSLGGTLAMAASDVPYQLYTDRGTHEGALRETNGTTLIIRLHGCTWQRDASGRLADERKLVSGIASAQTEALGYNALVRPWLLSHAHRSVNGSSNASAESYLSNQLNHSAVAVINASAVAVAIPALAEYDISSPEYIAVTVAPALLTYSSLAANVPRFEIAANPGTAALEVRSVQLAPQRASEELVEAAVQSRQNQLIFTLSNDTFRTELGTDCAQPSSITRKLLDVLTSTSEEVYGWNAVRAFLNAGASIL